MKHKVLALARWGDSPEINKQNIEFLAPGFAFYLNRMIQAGKASIT
jgi:hypothetical protein